MVKRHPFLSLYAVLLLTVQLSGLSPSTVPGSAYPVYGSLSAQPTTDGPLTAPSDLILPTDTVNGFAVGRTAGTGDVSADGMAEYSIPLWVPPGRAGAQPDLTLSYSSNTGDGPLGVGWSLSGFWQIARCRRTLLQDGGAREVRFENGDQGDRFCLIGQRLVVVGGPRGALSTYGGDETEYRTEVDQHAKVVSHGSDGAGPVSFTIYLKDGRILTLGGTPDSILHGPRVHWSAENKVVSTTGTGPVFDYQYTVDRSQDVRYAWSISRITDRAGNYVSIEYGDDSAGDMHEQVPERIYYTASTRDATVPATRMIRFSYEPRPDVREGYVGGFGLKQTMRLQHIEMLVSNSQIAVARRKAVVRAYNLTYRNDTISHRSLLSKIEECDGAGVCKPPTILDWTTGDPGFDMEPQANGDWQVPGSPPGGRIAPADTDGDGRDEIHAAGPATRFVDLNGDGRDDVIDVIPVPSSGGPNISPPPLYKHEVRYSLPPETTVVREDPVEQYDNLLKPAYAADLTGDGLPELLRPVPVKATEQYRWGIRFNDAGTLGPYVETTHDAPGNVSGSYDPHPYPNSFKRFAIDINGSGRYSLVQGDGEGALSVVDGRPVIEPTNLRVVPITHDGQTYYCWGHFLDVNGDGLVDWLTPTGITGSPQVSINTGHGFAEPTVWTVPAPYAGAFVGECGDDRLDGGARVLDYNLDGRDDLLLMAGYPTQGASYRNGPDPAITCDAYRHCTLAESSGTRSLVVLESTGAGFIPRPLAFLAGDHPSFPWGYTLSQVLDHNGDGLGDFVQVVNGKETIYTRRGDRPDLLTGVVDGFGAFEHFEYRSLNDPSVHSPGSDCGFPRACVTSGLWVVSRHLVDTGVSPNVDGVVPDDLEPLQTVYFYRDGRVDLAGRGWLGFAERTSLTTAVRGDRTHVITTYDHHTRTGTFYPCANFPISETTDVTLQAGTPAGRTGGLHRRTVASTCEVASQSGGTVVFAYPSDIQTREWERISGSSAELTLKRQQELRQVQDNYGNPRQQEAIDYAVEGGQVVGRGSYSTVKSGFDIFEGSWLIGQPSRQEWTSTTRTGRDLTRVVDHEYDAETGLLSKILVEPDSPNTDLHLETTFERDSFGLVVAVHRTGSGETRSERFAYDEVHHTFMTESTDPLGHTSSYLYDPGLGIVAATRDPNHLDTKFQYDGFGRPRHIDSPDAADTALRYDRDQSGRPRTVTQTAGSTPVETSYDRLGRPVFERWLGADGTWIGTETGYDHLGRVSSTTLPHSPVQRGLAYSYEYDGLDRVLRVRNPDGTSRSYQYQGATTSSHDEKGNVSFTVANELGDVIRSVDVDQSGREIATRYEYGPFGLLESVTGPDGHRTEMAYDLLGRRTRLDAPNLGASVTRFNAFGEVVAETDGNGDTVAFTHDALGRVTTMSSKDGPTAYTWDIAPHGVGMLAKTTSPDGVAVTYDYDALSRLERALWSMEGRDYAFDYGYDSFGRLETVAYPIVAGRPRFTVRNHYSPQGDLVRVEDATSGFVYWEVIARNPLGQPTTEQFGNHLVTKRRYDVLGRPRVIDTSGTDGIARQSLEFRYDPNGNVVQRYDRGRNPGGSPLSTEEFRYDTLDRLTNWDVRQFPNIRLSTHFSYDDTGNLVQRSVVTGPGESKAYTYGEEGAGPHAVTRVDSPSGSATYAYDHAGNQVEGPGRSVAYTAFDLPALIETPNGKSVFKYDAARHRVEKRYESGDAADTTVTIGGLYEERTNDKASSYVFTVATTDRPVAQVVWSQSEGGFSADAIRYLHDDHLGSPEMVTDAAGNVVERLKFDPFGKRLDPANLGLAAPQLAMDLRIGFTGHLHDDELGLIDMQGRIYDPGLGRFLSADPLVADPFASQSFNRYSYALNNPLRFTDPTGFQSEQLGRQHTFEPTTIMGETGADTCSGSCTFEEGETFEVENSPQQPSGSPASGPPTTSGATMSDDSSRRESPKMNDAASPAAPNASSSSQRAWVTLPVHVSSETGTTYGRDNVDVVLGMGQVTIFSAQSIAMYRAAGDLLRSAMKVVDTLPRSTDLSAKAAEIHNALLKSRPATFGPGGAIEHAHQLRTTAVLEGVDEAGNTVYVIASSSGKLEAAQLAVIDRIFAGARYILADGFGHAEIQALMAASANGLTPIAIGASRLVCTGCATAIGLTPALLDTPVKFPQ